jgi:hypothetical protein
MAGSVSPGQTLTSNPNVLAVAGMGGDVWGANGGGAVAIGGGAVDQTGYVKPIAITPSDCETATNYIPVVVNRAPPARSVLGQMNVDALSGQTQDSALASGGSNAG